MGVHRIGLGGIMHALQIPFTGAGRRRHGGDHHLPFIADLSKHQLKQVLEKRPGGIDRKGDGEPAYALPGLHRRILPGPAWLPALLLPVNFSAYPAEQHRHARIGAAEITGACCFWQVVLEGYG